MGGAAAASYFKRTEGQSGPPPWFPLQLSGLLPNSVLHLNSPEFNSDRGPIQVEFNSTGDVLGVANGRSKAIQSRLLYLQDHFWRALEL